MGEHPRRELFSGLASLYQSREWSDLVLFGREGTRHAVHRAIVCPRSDYFHKAVKEERWRVRYAKSNQMEAMYYSTYNFFVGRKASRVT